MNIDNLFKNKWILGIAGISLFAVIIVVIIGGGTTRRSLPAQTTESLTTKEVNILPAKEQEFSIEGDDLSTTSDQKKEPRIEETPNETYSEPEINVNPCAKTDCPDCQYCNHGDCLKYCQGTDNSCGCIGCIDCNKSDEWINTGVAYSCCDGDKICSCREQKYHDYHCSETSCDYSTTKTRINKTNCFDCGSSQHCSNGVCVFEKIEGLATIRISGGIWGNWDADIEKDGPIIDLVYLDTMGDIIANEATKKTPISADVKVYASTGVLATPDKLVFSASYSENQIILGEIYPSIRIPKEQMNVNPYTDYKYGDVEVTIYTPQQGPFSDRSEFIMLYE